MRPVARVRSIAAMQRYDVLVVNPIKDGLNLVAKEGPAVNTRDGLLCLSREAGAYEELSGTVMEGVEKMMVLKEPADSYRRNLITRIAAFSLEHPNERIDYHEVFSDIFDALQLSFGEIELRPLP